MRRILLGGCHSEQERLPRYPLFISTERSIVVARISGTLFVHEEANAFRVFEKRVDVHELRRVAMRYELDVHSTDVFFRVPGVSDQMLIRGHVFRVEYGRNPMAIDVSLDLVIRAVGSFAHINATTCSLMNPFFWLRTSTSAIICTSTPHKSGCSSFLMSSIEYHFKLPACSQHSVCPLAGTVA